MAAEIQHEMACSEFEALLSDALDGTLATASAERFAAHRQSCAVCGPMFAEAELGMKALRGLEEVEPPRMMVHRILAATTGREPTRETVAASPGWVERLRGLLPPVLHPVLQPRFGMSFAMAFFSLTMVFNLAGITPRDLRRADLRPGSLRDDAVRTYYETQARVVKYYENMRLVYEIESRVRDLRNNMGQEKPQPKKQDEKPREEKNKNINEKTSERPDREREERYSFDFAGNVLAMLNAPAHQQARGAAR
jgi:hypothetical protein